MAKSFAGLALCMFGLALPWGISAVIAYMLGGALIGWVAFTADHYEREYRRIVVIVAQHNERIRKMQAGE